MNPTETSDAENDAQAAPTRVVTLTIPEPGSYEFHAFRRIIDTEGTAFPWWCILDNPKAILKATPSEAAASMFAGPFFSRKAADDELDLHRHNYSKHAIVFCVTLGVRGVRTGTILDERPGLGAVVGCRDGSMHLVVGTHRDVAEQVVRARAGL